MVELIGFEGTDGSGKTSLSKGIAENNSGYDYMYFTEDNPLGALRRVADNQDPQIRFYYYLALNVLNHSRFSRMKKERDNSILLDRTPLSTVVYHTAMGVNTDLYKLFHPRFMRQFDQIVYVHASPEATRARIEERAGEQGVYKYDEYSLSEQETLHLAFLAWLPTHSSIVDTSKLTLDEAIDITHRKINHD